MTRADDPRVVETAALSSIRCPGCDNRVLARGPDGELTLRPKRQVRFDKGVCELQCFHCGRDLELPLVLQKSETGPARIALVIPSRRRGFP